MRHPLLSIGLALTLCVALLPHAACAHHTFVQHYDPQKLITISGTIGSVSFSNPHIHFTVTSTSGEWSVEAESISVANKLGLSQSVLKSGAKVTVTGWRARDGSSELGLRSIAIVGGPSVTIRKSAR